MLSWTTADLWDQHGTQLLCVDPIFRAFGNKSRFHGEIKTLKLFEDNSLLRQQLITDGKGKVMVVDGGGSLRCALLGDQLATLAIDNDWKGLIINGCVRDSAVINTMEVGIRALNTCPIKSFKRNQGEIDVPVKFAATLFQPGHYVYADEDGILVSATQIEC